MEVFGFVFVALIVSFAIYLRINRAKISGLWGEKKVSAVLSMLGKEYKVFNDVLIKNSYGTSQIDHLVVSPYGIFVIETKNYKGWILGGANSDKWTQNIWGNKYQLANPIRQNMGHIKALQNALPQYISSQYVSIIAFSHNSKLKVKVDDSYNVVYTLNVISRIRAYKEVILSDEQQNEYITALQKFLDSSKDEKKAHVSTVRQKSIRREAMINADICPQCGGSLIKRKGKYGSFYGCSNYPNCKFTTR